MAETPETQCPFCGFTQKRPRGLVGETCVWCKRAKYVAKPTLRDSGAAVVPDTGATNG